MRRVLISLTVFALLWSGCWIAGTYVIDQGVASWRESQRADGWQLEIEDQQISGAPLSWSVGWVDVKLAKPNEGLGFSAADVLVDVPSYWPFSGQVRFPETPLTFETPLGQVFIKLHKGQADAAMRPWRDPSLQAFAVRSDAWQLNNPRGNLASAALTDAALDQDPKDPHTYHVSVSLDALTPGDVLREMISLPTDWPRVMDHVVAELSLTLAAEAEAAAPLRQVDIRVLSLIWGDLSISALGNVAIDAGGIPDGELTLLTKNWRGLYEIMKENGNIPATVHFQADLMLNGLANMGGDPETLDLTVTFRDGDMFLGPILIGKAPRVLF